MNDQLAAYFELKNNNSSILSSDEDIELFDSEISEYEQ